MDVAAKADVMAAPSFRRVAPAATEAALAVLAQTLGSVLPAELHDFLKGQNGGKPDRAAFEVPKLGWTSVTRLYGTGTGGDYTIEAVAALVEFQNLPPATLVIGEDPGGNLLLIDAAGAIWFVAHCGWPLGSTPATVRLADGLDTFLASLVHVGQVPKSRWPADYAAIAAAAGHPEWGRDPPDGYSWHYDVPSRDMQLVPRDIHWMAPHVASILV